MKIKKDKRPPSDPHYICSLPLDPIIGWHSELAMAHPALW